MNNLTDAATTETTRIMPIPRQETLVCRAVCGYCGAPTPPDSATRRRIAVPRRLPIIRLYCSELCRESDHDEGAPLLSCLTCGISVPTLIFAQHPPYCAAHAPAAA